MSALNYSMDFIWWLNSTSPLTVPTAHQLHHTSSSYLPLSCLPPLWLHLLSSKIWSQVWQHQQLLIRHNNLWPNRSSRRLGHQVLTAVWQGRGPHQGRCFQTQSMFRPISFCLSERWCRCRLAPGLCGTQPQTNLAHSGPATSPIPVLFLLWSEVRKVACRCCSQNCNDLLDANHGSSQCSWTLDFLGACLSEEWSPRSFSRREIHLAHRSHFTHQQ